MFVNVQARTGGEDAADDLSIIRRKMGHAGNCLQGHIDRQSIHRATDSRVFSGGTGDRLGGWIL